MTMRLLLLLLAVNAGLLNGLDLDAEWSTFKMTFNKQYRDAREEAYRRQVWEFHVDFIQRHNLQADLGVHSFRVGVNQYADMPNKEFVARMTKGLQTEDKEAPWKKVPEAPLLYRPLMPRGGGSLPDTVDWRSKGYVTPVKNKGQCGSSWAFAATGALEGQHFQKAGKLVALSEQNLIDCSTAYGNHGCQGGSATNSFAYIRANKGIDTESAYPYEAQNNRCRFSRANVGANVTGFVEVKSGSEPDLQSAVANVGPIAAAVDASQLSFQLYASGVYYSSVCSPTKLDLGVLVVGYGAYQGKDYWMVKNSWGTSWGMEGYIMMTRNRNNNCGIATRASYPTV